MYCVYIAAALYTQGFVVDSRAVFGDRDVSPENLGSSELEHGYVAMPGEQRKLFYR